jgi:hypothetical protein
MSFRLTSRAEPSRAEPSRACSSVGWLAVVLGLTACDAPSAPPEEPLAQHIAPVWTPGWEPLPSTGSLLRSGLGVTSDPVGIRVWSHVLGFPDSLRSIRRSASGWDSSWTTHSLNIPISPFFPGVGAVRRADGVTNLVLNSNQSIYQSYFNGTTLFSFANTGGLSNERPAISSAGSMVHIWATGLNGHLWLYRWNGSSWDAWRDLGLLPGPVSLVGAPAAVVKPGTSTTVVVARTSSTVYTAEWNDSTATLSSWTLRGAPPGGMAEAPAVVGAQSGSQTYRIFQRNNATPSLLYEFNFNVFPFGQWFPVPSEAAPGITNLTNVTGAPGGVFLGTTPATGTHLVSPGNGQQANWRKWYDTTPAASLKMTTPRTLRVIHQRGGETFGPAGCETTEAQFEGTATVVPPGQVGCTNGALVMQPGTGLQRSAGTGSIYAYAMGVGAAPLNCLDGTVGGSSTCTAGGTTIPRCEAPGGDMIAPGTGMLTFYNGAWGADNLIDVWGRSPVTPRLSSLTQKGTTRAYPGGQGSGIARGASYFLDSTDCGATWTYNSMADACDPAFLSPTTTPTVCPVGGTDRPQTSAWTSAGGFAYAGIRVPLETFSNNRSPIFRRHLGTPGSTWTRVIDPTDPTKGLSVDQFMNCTFTSRPIALGNRVFWACITPGTIAATFNINLVYFDETSTSVSSGSVIRPNDFSEWQFANATPSAWPVISPVTQVGNDYYLRVAWPKQTTFSPGQSRQELRMSVLRVSGSTVQELSYTSISAMASGGSVVYPSFIIPVETQTQGPSSGLAMLTWYDTDTSDQSANAQGTSWGNVRYRGCVLRDLDPTCNPITLSVHNGVATSWPFTDYNVNLNPTPSFPGDYHESAGYFDTASNKYRFLVHYNQPTPDRDLIRANIVEVDP